MSKPYSDKRHRPRVQTVNDGPILTVQSEREQAELDSILLRHGAKGLVQLLNETELRFLDVEEVQDFADVMRTAKQAEIEFMKLPSKVREAFNHDTAEWLDAAHDPDKRAEALSRVQKLTGGTQDVAVDQKTLEGPSSPSTTDSATTPE